MLDLQAVNDRAEFAEDLIGLLVVFKLCSDQVCQVTQWLGGIKDLELEVRW